MFVLCTLAHATGQIDLSATNSQARVQNIPKEVPKGPLWGLQEWNKGEVCAEMLTPPSSDTPVSCSQEEMLCIQQWFKTKSLTQNRLEGFFTGGVNFF